MGIVEILRRVIAPGDRVIVNPPVYPPFFDLVTEAGGVVERVPLRDTGASWELDQAIERALEDGARRSAVQPAQPHRNRARRERPHGRVARLAERYGATVVSDEIHARSRSPKPRSRRFSPRARRHGPSATRL